MGVLVARKYPTKIALGLADHTYVECGTGARAWGCFGGKQGGSAFRSHGGSTRQADAISGPDEHSGLKCYLINGVCHQAANRILYAAGITVAGARGYGVSEAMFGVYGRVGFFPCSSAFDRHDGTSGDIPGCTGGEMAEVPSGPADETAYARSVARMYDAHRVLMHGEARPDAAAIKAFHLALFERMLDFRLSPDLDPGVRHRLLSIRADTEDRQLDIDRRHVGKGLRGPDLAREVDALAIDLQERVATTTSEAQYEQLFGLPKGDVVRLADPDIVATS